MTLWVQKQKTLLKADKTRGADPLAKTPWKGQPDQAFPIPWTFSLGLVSPFKIAITDAWVRVPLKNPTTSTI